MKNLQRAPIPQVVPELKERHELLQVPMPNLTLAIPMELKQKMKRHPEIRWSEVAKKAIAEKIEDLEVIERVAKKSRLTEKDAEEISGKIDAEVARRAGLE